MSHSYYNKSHCYDPTAKLALDNVDEERLKNKPRSVNKVEDRLDKETKKKLLKLCK